MHFSRNPAACPIDGGGHVRDHHHMEATFPSRTWTFAVAVIGAVGVFTTSAILIVQVDLTALVWAAPFIGAYAAGVVAFLLQPDQMASRRLLVFGTLATIFLGSAVAAVENFETQGHQWWLGPANVAVHVVGLAIEAAMVALVAIYPDGKYHRPYERRVVLTLVGVTIALPLASLMTHPTVQPSWGFAWGSTESPAFPAIASPVHLPWLGFLATPVGTILQGGLLVGPLIGSILVALRYRRLSRRQELQVRWPMYGVLLLLLAPLAALLHEFDALPRLAYDTIVIFALLVMPASVCIGLLKPDLFDVDAAMRRSFLYVPIWLAIAAAYLGLAAGLGAAASPLGLQVTVAVTIVATLLVEPARRRVARRAARWAGAGGLSGEEMVGWVSETLERTRDLPELTAALAKATSQRLGVRWTTIEVNGMDPATHGERRGEEPSLSTDLVHAGEHLGEIQCGPRTWGRVRAADVDGLAKLARQAALTIHNAQLAADLRESLREIQAQAVELSASRTRIVAAEALGRRQIERDIHDGAQQDLVALIARIGLARRGLSAEDDDVAAALDDLQTDVRTALANLRQLASGIHPTELTDHGLVEAIEGRSARSPLPVTVDCAPELRSRRFDEQTEVAAYYFVSEALANALKHADAEHVRVHVDHIDDLLQIDVSDDGVGFEHDGTAITGLSSLTDRVESLGGRVIIESTPGRGTRVGARLPVGGVRAD